MNKTKNIEYVYELYLIYLIFQTKPRFISKYLMQMYKY